MRAWLAGLSIRHQLWALFGLFLLTAACVLALAEISQHQARQSLVTLRDDSLVRVRLLKAVSDAYGLDVVGTTFRVRSGLMPWDEGVAAIDLAHAKIERNWIKLVRMSRAAAQQTLFDRTERARMRADRATAELRRILVARDLGALNRFADTELYPAIDPVTSRIKSLADLALIQADGLVQDDLERSQRDSLLRSGLSLLALLAVAVIGRWVLGRAYRGVESLTWLVRRMRAHDYTAIPPHPPQGELALVMDALLTMRHDVLGYETALTDQLADNERTRAELARRERFQRSLLEAVQVAIFAIDAQGRWSVFNPFAERMLGWSSDEVVGKVVHGTGDALITPTLIAAVMSRLGELTGRPAPSDWHVLFELAALCAPPAEANLLHRDGHTVPVLMALAAFDDDHGERAGVIAVATDLTALKRLEDDLRDSEARAQAASHAKSSFLAAMSHEIRTPLIGVTGMIEVLASTRLDLDQRRTLNILEQSSQSLLQVIGDILDFSKIEAGRLELAPEVVSLPKLVRSTVANYSGAASSKGLALECRIDEHVGPAHYTDPMRLRQILGNLLSNAIKFTEQGQVQVALEWLGADDDERDDALGSDRLSLRVTDSGIGISEQAQRQLFQPFSQAEGDTTRRFGGTGLGLAICRRLAGLMGGEVTLESEPGSGTTTQLALVLPRARAEDLPPEPVGLGQLATFTPRQLPTVEQALAECSLVLLVDDHPTNRLVIARQLGLAGYASESAEGGAIALERWRSGRYALLLSDVHMPGLDGYQLARAVREIEANEALPRIPIIALTASALKGEAERCLAAGMDDYLAKPVSVPVLLACLQRWLPHTARAACTEPARDPDAQADGIVAPLSQLADPPVLDENELAQLSDGSREDTRALLQDFLASTAQDLAELDAARAHGDAPALTRQAHKIKGAARLVGAGDLAQAAGALETAAREGSWALVLPLATDVTTAAQRLRLYVAERYPG